MKVSPLTASPGTLGSVDVGRTADPVKMERARSIARGEKAQEPSPDAQVERIKQDVNKIKMKTQRSVYRDEPTETDDAPATIIPESTEPAAVEATQPLSPQFAALAKQKRALQVKERELADREKALASNPPKIDESELIARLKSKPLSVLQEHGVTYDQLTEAILSGQDGINPEIQALRDELKAVKEDVNKTLSNKEERAEEAALTEMLYEAESLAKEGDAFEMIRERNAYEKVLRLIHDTYKKTGRVLDVSDAMNKVEDTLLKDAEVFARIGKVQKRIAPPPAPPLQPQQKGMRTLTARDSASSVMSAKARAIAAFNGTLRK